MDEIFPSYNSWDLTLPEVPPRSWLYCLPPVGIGTSYVESLTGYIARLARLHYVNTGTLLAKEFVTFLRQPNSKSYLHGMSSRTEAFNGTGAMAADLVQALERLTTQNNLRLLTMLTWAEVFPAKGLLRRNRAWCPKCYEDYLTGNQPVCDLLLWSLEVVKICPYHRQPLHTHCPYCERQLPCLGWLSRPGCCSKCGEWLGQQLKDTEEEPGGLDWQLWVSETVGDLFVKAPSLPSPPTRERVARKLRACIDQIAKGNTAEFARQLEMPKNTVWLWMSGKVLPQLDALLKICHYLELPVSDFLIETGINLENSGAIRTSHSPVIFNSRRSASKSFDASKIHSLLKEFLDNDTYTSWSMQRIAKQLNYDPNFLRRHFPELCRNLSGRYLEYRKSKHISKINQKCLEVQEIAIKLYEEGEEPTRSSISLRLGKPAYFREEEVCMALDKVRYQLGFL
ncbi:helix-turn-helix domain-containing protein [Oscillatoria sp. FACHB-1407]|uniref:helix-turn-helix domain-containing protein n=1 Tax=Oscillatoria sp. FACHB-1407 TaxID=2692847 RepID=UPI001686DB06|nr:helix-turn-helix domain-containing protein [Oscillatoria sp. FACHB-1407]MBD2461657.1 helix-turn-helix domain-containing protein [Oscillatoria sp. FACHB-1407]